MLHLPILRWGQPYKSLEADEVKHFASGEPIAKIDRANGGLIQRDRRGALRARDVLRELTVDDLIARVGAAGELYMNAELPMGRRRRRSLRARSQPVPGCPSGCASRT